MISSIIPYGRIKGKNMKNKKTLGVFVKQIGSDLCPVCFMNQIERRLYEKSVLGPENEMILSHLERNVRPEKDNLSDSDCQFCGSRKVRIQIYEIILKAKDSIRETIYKDFDLIFKTEIPSNIHSILFGISSILCLQQLFL